MSIPADHATPGGDPVPREPSRGTDHAAVAAAVTGVILFSTGPVIVAGADLEGLAFAFWRLWAATAVVNLILATRGRRLDRSVLVATAPAGIALGVNMALFFSAVQQTSVANATLISVLSPIPLLIVGRLAFGESATGRDVAWILLAIAGAALVLRSSNSEGTGELGGDLLALGSMVALALYFAAGKRARHTVDTLAFMAGLFTWGAIVITPIALVSGQDLLRDNSGAETWLRIALVVALPGTGHALTNFAHNGVPLSVIGILQLANPVGAALLAYWLLDQTVAGLQVVGMVVVIGALGAYTYQRSPPAA